MKTLLALLISLTLITPTFAHEITQEHAHSYPAETVTHPEWYWHNKGPGGLRNYTYFKAQLYKIRELLDKAGEDHPLYIKYSDRLDAYREKLEDDKDGCIKEVDDYKLKRSGGTGNVDACIYYRGREYKLSKRG